MTEKEFKWYFDKIFSEYYDENIEIDFKYKVTKFGFKNFLYRFFNRNKINAERDFALIRCQLRKEILRNKYIEENDKQTNQDMIVKLQDIILEKKKELLDKEVGKIG